MASKSAAGDVLIYHNPKCGTSRKALALIRAAGTEPRVVEYLKQPPSRRELADLARRMGVPLRGLLRAKGTPFGELGLDRPEVGEQAILDAIAEHPILIDRPIVVTARGARLCRPAELVRELLSGAPPSAGAKPKSAPKAAGAGPARPKSRPA